MIKRFKKSKNKPISPVSQKIIVFSLIVILVFLIRADFRLWEKKIRTDNQVRILQEKVYNLSNINNNLKNKVSASFDRDYIEKVLREKGIYKKPDEEAIVVLPPQEITSTNKTPRSSLENLPSDFSFPRIKEAIVRMFKKIFNMR